MSVFKKGTLLIPTGPVKHLHIVMNDPVFFPELGYVAVLVVNISSIKSGQSYDESCILQPGLHPFITCDSYVYYKDAAILRVPRILERMQLGEISQHASVSESVFTEILAGFDKSKHVKQKIKRFIRKYILEEPL